MSNTPTRSWQARICEATDAKQVKENAPFSDENAPLSEANAVDSDDNAPSAAVNSSITSANGAATPETAYSPTRRGVANQRLSVSHALVWFEPF
jgi:hypothetical protein